MRKGNIHANGQRKRAFRKKRSELKRHVYRGGELTLSEKKVYRVKLSYPKRENWNRQQLLAKLYDKIDPLYFIEFPKIFCLMKEPEKTLSFLNEQKTYLRKYRPTNIFISHEATEELELTASSVFDQMILELKNYWREKERKLHVNGISSRKKRVNNFLVSFGLLKRLGINPNQLHTAIDSDYENKFAMYSEEGCKKQPHLNGTASAGLGQYFDTCLLHTGHRLKDDGRLSLIDAIGELLGNAEEHAEINADDVVEWQVYGCFEKDTKQARFAIINSGLSIFESLSNENSTSKEVLEKIQQVVLSHRSLGQKITDGLKEYVFDQKLVEPIWNVMALQEGISSKRSDDEEGKTRGRGLMDVLEFFSELHKSNQDANVVIISGHSHIEVDYTYPVTKKRIELQGPDGLVIEHWRQICFNSEGDLHKPQDGAKVRCLNEHFPGTIITGRFNLSPVTVQKLNGKTEGLNGHG